MIFTVGSFLTIDSNSFHPIYFTLETITWLQYEAFCTNKLFFYVTVL